MAKPVRASINPYMLQYLRKKRGYAVPTVAKRVRVKPEKVEEWEAGTSQPTIRQALEISNLFQNPLSAFYLEKVPRPLNLAQRDFRRVQVVDDAEPSPELIREMRHARIKQQIMIDLANQNEGYFEQLNSISLSMPAHDIAEKIRQILDIDWETQSGWRDPYSAFNGWKQAIEAHNVLVFFTYHRGKIVPFSEARGFSFSDPRYPVITINHKDALRGRIFTLLHEFTHLLLNAGGLCDCYEYKSFQSPEQQIETYCNHVAGAVLVPSDLLLKHWIVRDHLSGELWSDDEISILGQEFSTSNEVIVRRLLINKLTTIDFYRQKRAEYEARGEKAQKRLKEKKEFKIPVATMALRRHGKPFSRKVFEAYYDDRISIVDVTDYLGVKVKSLRDIEKKAFTGV